MTPKKDFKLGAFVSFSHFSHLFDENFERIIAGKQKAKTHWIAEETKIWYLSEPKDIAFIIEPIKEENNSKMKNEPKRTAIRIPADSLMDFMKGLVAGISLAYKLSNFFLLKTKFLPRYFSLTTGFSANSSLVP